MRKLLSSLLALALLGGTACSAAPGPETPGSAPETVVLSAEQPLRHPFADVQEEAWYAEAVAYCYGRGLLSGTSDTGFSPNGSMTRAMLALVLYRLAGSPETEDAAAFLDVPAGAWYGDAVTWAAESGVITGYGGGVFGAKDPVTREQIAAIIWRYEGAPEPGTATEPFADAVEISGWARTAVDWARASGLVDGRAGNRFAPKAGATRAELAALLYRWLGGANAGGGVLVAYFSATGTTRELAGYAAGLLGADLYEIVPETTYTAADLDYGDSASRTTREQSDPTVRPAIRGGVEGMEGYAAVLLGYPIWHGQAPRIISTFLESYDFAGKTVVPFCTSHSSGLGGSDTALHALAPEAAWLEGKRFPGGTDRETVEEWIGELGLPAQGTAANPGGFDFETRSVTLNSGYAMPINGLGTYSLRGDVCISSVTAALQSGVRLIDTAHIYGNEAEVGQAIRDADIPREDIFVITKLYPDQFSDAEAAIDLALETLDLGYIDMMLLHHPGAGDVAAYKAMERAVKDGKIRSIGLSNWYVEELEAFLPQVAVTPSLVQNEIHPYYQENDVIPYIQNLGITVQGWYPLGGRGHTAELLGDPVILEIAAAHGVSSAQVILRWNLQKGVVAIPGSSDPDHIRENTELYHFELTEDEMARINALDRDEKHDWY